MPRKKHQDRAVTVKLSHEHLQAIEDIKAKEKERGLVLNNFTPRMTGRQWWRRWESKPRPDTSSSKGKPQ